MCCFISSIVIVGVVDAGADTVDHLAKVVRRDVGRHAHRNAGAAVDQQVRERRRQNHRLGFEFSS